MSIADWAICLAALSTLILALFTLRLALATSKMAETSQASVDEMKRQFNLLYKPDLQVSLYNQNPQRHDHVSSLLLVVTNVGAAAAIHPRVTIQWDTAMPENIGEISGTCTSQPHTGAWGRVILPSQEANFSLVLPDRDGGAFTVTWSDAAGQPYQRDWRLFLDSADHLWKTLPV